MRENRDVVMPWIFQSEGSYVLRDDLGQANMGIGLHTLYTYRKKHQLQIPVYADLKNLSKEEATDIYFELFFTPCRFDDLKSGLDYAVVDTCINLGVHGGASLLQQAFKRPESGKFDDDFVAFLNADNELEKIDGVRDAWITYKRIQPLYHLRGPGWENRDKRVRLQCQQLYEMRKNDMSYQERLRTT